MAFPWVFEDDFESGSDAGWDSKTDTASQLDFPHYSELARFPWAGAVPYRGAYCMRASLTGGTADAFVTEGDINIADNTERFFRFCIQFSPDFDATANDTVNVFECQDTSNNIEATFGFRYVAATDVINFGVGNEAPTAWASESIERGVWYTVELDVDLDESTENDGSIKLYITKEGEPPATTASATASSLDQNAVTHGVLGIQGHLATTTGTILFDQFVMDDARIYPITDRFSKHRVMTKSGHVTLGPGKLSKVVLLSGAGTNNVAQVFDTDVANTNDASNMVMELKNTANNQRVESDAAVPIEHRRGAYVSLAGTNPRALVTLDCSRAMSDGSIRELGKVRTNSAR